MILSVCLVTRNEEQNLPMVLRSVAGVADEVIVADTGSSDRTREAAESMGARVFLHDWQDDFSAARNFALDQARGAWVLWLNPDEELLPKNRHLLPNLLGQEDILAYWVRVEEINKPDRPGPVMATSQPRFFRRRADVRYAGRLHPQFVVPLELLAHPEKLRLASADLAIRHHAYLSVLTEDKLRWALNLLEKELQDRPGQLHFMIEQGRTLLRLNDARGHKVLAQAALELRGFVKDPLPPTATVAALLEYQLTVAPEQSESKLSPAEAEELARQWFPKTPPLLWTLAQRAFQAWNYRQAAEILENLVQLGRSGAYDRSAPFDPAIMHETAILNLGKCYTQLGDFDRAEFCFGQLLTDPTHQAEARQNYGYIQGLRRKTGSP